MQSPVRRKNRSQKNSRASLRKRRYAEGRRRNTLRKKRSRKNATEGTVCYLHHMSPFVMFILFLVPYHCLLSTILASSWVMVFLPCITTWKATISYFLCHLMGSNPKILIQDFVLSMMIHVTLVYESLYLSGYVFLLEMVLYWLKHAQRKKEKKEITHHLYVYYIVLLWAHA